MKPFLFFAFKNTQLNKRNKSKNKNKDDFAIVAKGDK